MDDALQHRLDAIERRQYLILAVVILPYLFAAGRFLLQTFGVTALLAAGVGCVMLLFTGAVYIGYLAHQPSRR